MATNPADLMKQFDQTGSSDDPYPFAPVDTTSVVGPKDVLPQTWGQTVTDPLKALVGSSYHQIGDAERWFGSTIGDYDLSKSWRQSGEAWDKSGQDWTGSISPAGQQITNAPIFSAETAAHPFEKTVMGIGKGGLWNLPAVIPGGGIVSGLARAGIGAALSYTGSYGDVVDSIKNQPDDQLQKSSPQYMELRKTYPEFQAKQMLADAAWDNMSGASKALAAGTGALAGEAGPLTAVGKTISGAGGKTLSSLAIGRAGRVAIGAGEAGGIQAGQYAGSAIPTREALTSVGAPADTPSDIAWGSIEQGAVGAVIGGGLRVFKPKGGENEANSRDTTGKGQSAGGQVTVVPEGQADPAQAQALTSAAQPTPGDQANTSLSPVRARNMDPSLFQQPTPPPTRPYMPTNMDPSLFAGPPRNMSSGLFDRSQPPPIPPRPGELPLEQPEQPPPGARGPQGELPLRPPQSEPQQGELPLQQPRQGVTQLGLPGMGTDVVHEPPETIARTPEPATITTPEPAPAPEPAAKPTKSVKPAKEPVTKVSEPEPTAAPDELKGRIQKVVDDHPTPDNEKVATLNDRKAIQERASSVDDKITPEDKKAILALPKEETPLKSYVTFANILADKKVPTASDVRNFLNAEKQVRGHLGGEEEPTPTPTPAPKPKPKGTFDTSKLEGEAPPKAAQPAKGAALKKGTAKGTFDTSKLEGKAEAPAVPPTKAALKRQAAIDKLVGKKEAPTQVERPTVEPTKGEPKVTVVPPSDARLGGIVPGAKARAIAAKFAPKGEEPIPIPKTPPKAPIKDLRKLGAALAAKEEGAPEPAATGKIADAIKDVLTTHSDILNRIEKAFSEDEKPPPKAGAKGAALKKGTFDVSKLTPEAAKVEDAKAQVAENPTAAQEEAGNFKQGHPPASATHGQPVTIHSAEGEAGQAEGHILGTAKNVPAEHLEVLIRHQADQGKSFYVINKVDEEGHFDGHIAVTGAASKSDAYTAYTSKLQRDIPGMNLEKAMLRFSGVEEMSPQDFEHFKQTRNPNEPVYPSTEGQHPFNEVELRGGKVKTLGSSTAKEALQQALRDLPDDPKYIIYRKLAEQAIKYLPDVPVYYVKTGDIGSQTAGALYNLQRNQILMGDKPVPGMPHQVVLLHEMMHATMQHLYSVNKNFRTTMDRMFKEYMDKLPKDEIPTIDIRKGGVEEFIAEFANPVVQRQMARVLMSKSLAEDLDMGAWAKGTQTLWAGAVKAFKDGLEKLGFKIPGKDDASRYTILDGMLRMSDDAFMHRSRLARTDFANMTRVMNEHTNNIETVREKQHDTQQSIVDTVHAAASNPSSAETILEKSGASVSDRAEDLLARRPRGIGTEAYYSFASKLMTTDTFRMANEKFFGKLDENNPFRKYVEKTLQRARDFEERLNVKRDFVAKMAKATAEIGKQETEKLSDILSKATAYRFDPRSPIGEGMNGWLKTAADRLAAARAKGEEDPNLFYKHQQAMDKSGELLSAFNALHPKAKEWFGKLVDDYAAKGRERAEIAVDALLHTIDSEGRKFIAEPKLDPTNPKSVDAVEYAKYHNKFETDWDKNKAGLRQRILDDDLTENDTEWLANRGIDTTDDIHALSVPKGPYVPLDHAGDWLINARYKITPPTNGKQINDNTYEFKTPEAMREFLSKQPPNSRPYVVHYNDKGEVTSKAENWQNPDGSMGFAKDNRAWRVEVNDKYYSGHDNLSSAKKRFEELKATGAFAKIAEPALKQTGWYSQMEVASPLFKKLINSIDRRTDYTEDQKKSVKQLLTDTAIGSMEGNRIAKTLLPRKMVAGWDSDFIKTYDKYADMHNALISRNKYAKEMGDIQNEMIQHAKDNEYERGNTERSAILDELHDRDNFFGSPSYVGGEDSKLGKKVAPVLRKAGAISFLNHMVSVGHVITHATHQIITADMVAAKYGGLGTMGEAARLHSILSGAGFKNAWRSVIEAKNVITKDSKGLNYVEGLMDALKSHRYGAELQAFMDKAIATGRVHPDQGFDTSIYHMSSGKLDAWSSKLDRMSRQLLGSTEAYNRVWGHALAYIRAREAGENIEQATRSSFDMVSQSQGLLSRANMSPIMSKWYMRPTMQFRGWGMNMMMNICRSFYNAFKGETREAKVEAWKRIAYLFGTTAALTGVNGLPSDPMRIALALAGALNITNYNWSDAQDAMREKFAELGGSGFANLAMDGLLGSLGPFSFFGADRIGFGSLLVFGEPQSSSLPDFSAWMWGLVGGAPGQTVSNVVHGINDLRQGNYADAIAKLVPLKIINDWAKAWSGYTEGKPTGTGVPGMPPYSTGEAIMQGLGLTPARQERYREARTAELRAEKTSRDEVSQLLNAVGTSNAGPDRLRAMQQVSAYNLQHPEDRITPQDVAKAIRRSTAPSGLGKTLTNRNRERIQQLQNYYGL